MYGDVRILLSITAVSPNLQKLSFNGNMTDATLIEIAEKSRHLRFLGLCKASCSHSAFITMTTICTDIVSLDLSYTTVTDEVIESVAVNLKHLCRLNLQNCGNLTNTALHSLEMHRASTLQILWLCNSLRASYNSNITSEAIVALKSAVPTLYVYWYLTVSPTRNIIMTTSDFEACTALSFFGSVQNALPFASQYKNLAIISVYDFNSKGDIETDSAAMAELARCCPYLHTIVVREEDLHAMKSAIAAVSSSINVTRSGACLSPNLHDYPV